MNCFTSYKKFDADTHIGYKVVVMQTYTSFDAEEIKALEEHLQKTIGSGLTIEVQTKNGMRESFYDHIWCIDCETCGYRDLPSDAYPNKK